MPRPPRNWYQLPRYKFPNIAKPDKMPGGSSCVYTAIYPRATSSVTGLTNYGIELKWAPGPEFARSPQQSTLKQLYGYEWWIRLCENGELLIGQIDEAGAAVLDTGFVAPTFGASAHHFSLSFEQTADEAVAWEESGNNMYVTQIDAQSQVRVTRGPFTGTDPVLFNDVEVLQTTADSDLILLYLSTDRKTLHYRLQRDAYLTEYDVDSGNLGTYTPGATEMVLDGVDCLALQLQILVADSDGNPFISGGQVELITDLIPYQPPPDRVEVVGRSTDLESEVFRVQALGAFDMIEVLGRSTDLEHELFRFQQFADDLVDMLGRSTDLEHELFRFQQLAESLVDMLGRSTDLEHELFRVREIATPSLIDMVARSTDLEHQTV